MASGVFEPSPNCPVRARTISQLPSMESISDYRQRLVAILSMFAQFPGLFTYLA